MTEVKSKTTTADATASEERVITVVTTRGEKTKIHFKNGGTWGDLKKALEKGGKNIDGGSYSGYDLSNMKCVESINKTTLEHPKANVPDGNLNLFLMPYKSKSGAMSRSDINATIKGFIEKDGDKAKAHFTVDGKNYTQVSSAKLEELIESYKPGTRGRVAKEKGEAISQVVESVKDAKTEEDILANLSGLSDSEKIDVIIKLLLDMKKGVSAAPAEKEERERKEREAEEKRLKEEADEKETKELQNEMGDLMGGFNDVKR